MFTSLVFSVPSQPIISPAYNVCGETLMDGLSSEVHIDHLISSSGKTREIELNQACVSEKL